MYEPTAKSTSLVDSIVNSFRGLTLSECEQVCAYCMIKHSELSNEAISQQKKDYLKFLIA
jgi:hypothetical protein